MSRRPNDEFHCPLDPLLEDLPAEAPPADLEQRCLKAVHGAAGERPGDRFHHLRPAAAAAAFLMLVAGVATFPRVLRNVTGDDHAAQAVEGARTPGAPEVASPASPADGARAKQPIPEPMTALTGDDTRWYGRAAPSGTAEGGASPYHFGTPVRSGAAFRLGGDVVTAFDIARAPRTGMPSDEPPTPRDEPATPAAPWEDTGEERQKEVYKRLEIEVDHVEAAHERAVQVIDQAGGYVAQEDLTTTADSGSEATLSARVPVDRLEDAVAQLRGLGRVLNLHGTSEDRTAEYYGRGRQVRDTRAEEERLVRLYESEKDRAKKQALYARLTQVRSRLHSQKEALKKLGARTHYATLELALSQRQGTREFVAEVGSRAVLALIWTLATALIWGPLLLLVLALRWRCPRPDRPGEVPEQ